MSSVDSFRHWLSILGILVVSVVFLSFVAFLSDVGSFSTGFAPSLSLSSPPSRLVSGEVLPFVCGNGFVDPGESCDMGSSTLPSPACGKVGSYSLSCHGLEFSSSVECQCSCAILHGVDTCPVGFSCESIPVTLPTGLSVTKNVCQPSVVSSVCGDGVCSPGEDFVCAEDCVPVPTPGSASISSPLVGETFFVNLEDFIGKKNPLTDSMGSFNQRLAVAENGVMALGLRVNGLAYLLFSSTSGLVWNVKYAGPPTSQPPVVLSGSDRRIFAIFLDESLDGCVGGRFLRWDVVNPPHGYALARDACIGDLSTKWSADIDSAKGLVYVSRRNAGADLGVIVLDEDGVVLSGDTFSESIVENVVYSPGVDIDTQYHSLRVASDGSLGLLYSTQRHPGNVNEKVLCLRSLDEGHSWMGGSSVLVSTPFSADAYVGTASPISYYTGPPKSIPEQGYVTNLLMTEDPVSGGTDTHILYFGSSGSTFNGVFYVRLNDSGVEEVRQSLPVGYHSFLVDGGNACSTSWAPLPLMGKVTQRSM
ncbi:MAG: hypothetical protein AABW68_05060 [archaeon]